METGLLRKNEGLEERRSELDFEQSPPALSKVRCGYICHLQVLGQGGCDTLT